MMAVIINRIELENYRQYKKLSLDFLKNNNNNLHVLKAKNGTGKTTFLNAITWCLYGEEKYINIEDKALNLPNEKVIENTEENNIVKVLARIMIKDEDANKTIFFTREARYRIKFNILTKSKKALKESQKFNIAITSTLNVENSQIIDDQVECEQFVNTYFNKAIFDYYFFDGENLKNYFTQSKRETIQNSIFNISQVTLLENTKKRAENLSVIKARKLNRSNPTENNYYEEKLNLEKEILNRTNENKKLEAEITQFVENKLKADEILNNYGPIKFEQKRKIELENYLKKNIEDFNNLRNEQYQFIQEYSVLLRFYPRIKRTYDMICYKEAHDELPPNIDKKEIKEIIDKHLTKCPVCNSEIDDDAIKYLQHLLDETAVSTGTSHQLMKIKSSLEFMLQTIEQFEQNKTRLFNIEKTLREERKSYEDDLSAIHSYLSNFSTEDLEADISTAEKDSKYYENKISANKSTIAQNLGLNKIDNNRLEELEKKLDKLEEKMKEKNELSKQVALLRKITNHYELIKGKIMKVVKDEIEKNTWKTFDAMIWKKHTFKSLSIDDNYQISVLNMNNKEIIGSLSATEYMALAYSFTLAIHEASGKNCPLVVDSPLGRVSDDNREKMARELLKVSRDKQIIMLFTPDEYSSEVQNVYEGNIASIRVLSLSEDESEVCGGNI